MKILGTRAIAFIGAWVMIGCAPVGLLAEETVGEKFRKVLADIDTWCRQEKIGPYLDPNDPEYKNKRRGTDCDILKLEPRDWRTEKMVRSEGQLYPVPERWLATPEGRFAHSIKLPAPHDKPKDVYRPGMGGKEYFEALCREEAGEFVFGTIERVEGILRLRLPEVAIDELLRHLFTTEGTTGMSLWHVTGDKDDIGAVLVQPSHGRYRYVEAPAFPRTVKQDGFPFRRFLRDPARATGSAINYTPKGGTFSVPNEIVDDGIVRPMARYGFTWRGIVRPNDREMGIAGAELIIVDTKSDEVMAVRRVFRGTTVGKNGAWWLTAGNCSKELATLPARFLYRVLRPAD